MNQNNQAYPPPSSQNIPSNQSLNNMQYSSHLPVSRLNLDLLGSRAALAQHSMSGGLTSAMHRRLEQTHCPTSMDLLFHGATASQAAHATTMSRLLEQEASNRRALLQLQLQRQSQLGADARELFLLSSNSTSSVPSLSHHHLMALQQSSDNSSARLRDLMAAMTIRREASLPSYQRSLYNSPSLSAAVPLNDTPVDTNAIESMSSRLLHPDALHLGQALQQTHDVATSNNRALGDLSGKGKHKEDAPSGLNKWDESDEAYFSSRNSCTDIETRDDVARIFDNDIKNSKENFPLKLYRMLYETERDGHSDVISFLSHGRAFMIHDTNRFVTEVMPRYFAAGRLNTFLKNLGLYSFQRITHGEERGAYFHQHFVQGKRDWCSRIIRKKTRIPKAVLLQREREKALKQKQQEDLEDNSGG